MNELSEPEKEFVRSVYVNDESVLEKSSAKIRALLQEYPNVLRFDLNRHLSTLKYMSVADRSERIPFIHQLIDIDASCLLKQEDDSLCVPLHCMLWDTYDDHEKNEPA
jgi:hypothetical protein